MPLDIATVLTLAAACAPTVAPTTLLAVAQVESALDPLAIGVNGPARGGPRARTAAEAVRRAEALIAEGRDLDLGLGQINVRNLAWLGLSVADAFDPCRNLAASARVLTDGYRRARPAPGREQQALRTALSFYNTGHPQRGVRNGYVARVAAAAGVKATAAPPPPAAAAPVPVPAAPAVAWDVFARARSRSAALVFTTSPGGPP